jgi:choline dehydrogenase-like flavoprotein
MNSVSILPVLLRPKSRGEVRLQSSSPWDAPLLDPKYLTEEEDVELLVEAVETAFQMVNNSKRLQEHKFQVLGYLLHSPPSHEVCEDHWMYVEHKVYARVDT